VKRRGGPGLEVHGGIASPRLCRGPVAKHALESGAAIGLAAWKTRDAPAGRLSEYMVPMKIKNVLDVLGRHAGRAWRSRSLRAGRAGVAAHALPILAALASVGFEHAEAGILRNPPVVNGLARATLAEVGLRTAGLDRTEEVRRHAQRFRIGWHLSERIYDAAVQNGLDVELAYRLVRVESSFRQRAIGPAGSIGFTQVQPGTARWLDPGVTAEELFEVDTNLGLGFRYLRMLIDRYGDTRLALLAYNRGPATVEALMAVGEDPANGYAARVLGGGAR